jgi:hypothetical protein
MKIVILCCGAFVLAACSSDAVNSIDSGTDGQAGMDGTMMDSTAMTDTGQQDTSMSSDAPKDNQSVDAPADVALDVGAGHCLDGIKDADETDTDCGGSTCAPCLTGKACIKNSDCVSNMCKNNVCQ